MIREIVESIIPRPLWCKLGNLRRQWISRNDAEKSTQEVFSRIYANGLWGRNNSSGDGSRDAWSVEPYLEMVSTWARDHEAAGLRALDLGCGDFQIGSRLFPLFGQYTAVDIVPALISMHQANPAYEKVTFRCVNAIEEELPAADVVFVRQVLQHLSNEEILHILPKLRNFKYALISEHLPSATRFRTKNADKVHGGGIRLKNGSGVYLEAPPFSLQCVESTLLLEVPGGPDVERDGIIQTTCYRFF